MILWMKPLLLLAAVTLSGCVSIKFENASDLVKRHPKGFADAVNASPESEAFVRDCLHSINGLEEILEKQ